MSNTGRSARHSWRVVWTLMLGGVLLLGGRLAALAQDSGWSEPVALSDSTLWSWFPDLAVDVYGTPHVVWCWTEPVEVEGGEEGGLQEQVMYTSRREGVWERPNDIVPRSADIIRNAIATDQAGNIHLVFGGSVYDVFRLYYQRAPVDKAWSAAAWSKPRLLNQGRGYMGDIVVDSKGWLHVIYDDTRDTSSKRRVLADIYYRRSTDGGETWSLSRILYEAPLTGSTKPQMKIDSNDVIYVTWEEGWDRLTGAVEDDRYAVYLASLDGGETWTEPRLIEYPDAAVVQLAAGSDGKGGVMLVWRSMKQDLIFYQWSNDGGQTWQEPDVIPQIFARPWTNPHDIYDMATDSDGRIHLVVVGRSSLDQNALQKVVHLVWDGRRWSAPATIFAQQGLYPQYSKIVVYEGNQLYATWFTWEGSVWEQDVSRVVWYSQRQISAPRTPVTPWPTATPVVEQATPTPNPTPTPTPYPQFNREESGLPDGLYTENDEVFQVMIALSPVALVIGVLAVMRGRWGRRFFG